MLGLARRVLGNAADAEDVAQEAMLRVWTHAPRWQPLAALRTWLTRVVVNLCLDRKRRAHWVDLEAAGEIVDPRPRVAEQAEGGERETGAGRNQRTACPPAHSDRAHLQRGHEQCAGGRILDTTVSAVETLLVRGKQNLRRALGNVIEED